jgi:hypothetical protein
MSGSTTRRPDGSVRFEVQGPGSALSRDWWYSAYTDGIMPDIDFLARDHLTDERVQLGSQPTPSWIWYGGFVWGPEDRDLYIEYIVSSPRHPVTEYGILDMHGLYTVGRQLSIGGGPWPVDSMGAPPAVTGLRATPAPGVVGLSWDPPDRSVAPHQARMRITATATPGTIVYGRRTPVTVTATLTGVLDGVPLAGAPVRFESTPDIGNGTTQTNAAGRAAITFAGEFTENTSFVISYAGDADHAAASGSVRVLLVRWVTEWIDHARARAGTPVHLSALPTPSGANLKTYLQTTCGGVACTLGPHQTNGHGQVTYTITAPPRGVTRKYRVKVPATWQHAGSYGSWIAITGI